MCLNSILLWDLIFCPPAFCSLVWIIDFCAKKQQPYFWTVPYYQHWTWNMDTNVPTRPSCVSSVHGDIFSAVTAARRNHLNIWTLLVTAIAMNATIKYKYPIKVTRRIKMYPAVCLEEIITLVTAWLVDRASNEGSQSQSRRPSPGCKFLLVLSHLRHYAKQAPIMISRHKIWTLTQLS